MGGLARLSIFTSMIEPVNNISCPLYLPDARAAAYLTGARLCCSTASWMAGSGNTALPSPCAHHIPSAAPSMPWCMGKVAHWVCVAFNKRMNAGKMPMLASIKRTDARQRWVMCPSLLYMLHAALLPCMTPVSTLPCTKQCHTLLTLHNLLASQLKPYSTH